MAFTPAGMFYLGDEDFGPGMDRLGAGVRSMVGVQNEDEAIKALAQKWDINDINQRGQFFDAVNKINPEKARELMAEAVEYDKGVAGKEFKEAQIAESRKPSAASVKGIASRVGNFILGEPIAHWYPSIMGINYDPSVTGASTELTRFKGKVKAFQDNFALWLAEQNLTRQDVAMYQKDTKERAKLLSIYAEKHGDELARIISRQLISADPSNGMNVPTNQSTTESTTTKTVEPEDYGYDKKDFHLWLGKWHWNAGPNQGKPLEDTIVEDAQNQAFEVNSSVFGGN